MKLDFCKLEVTILHSFTSFDTLYDKIMNFRSICQYFCAMDTGAIDPKQPQDITSGDYLVEMKFDNTQLDCELKLIDSTTPGANKFTFVVYNMPATTLFAVDDYLLFKYYWESDPTKYLFYHTVIQNIQSKRVGGDLQTTIKGVVVDQDILANWSVYRTSPLLQYTSDIADFIKNELQLDIYSTVNVPEAHIKLPAPIYTYGKTVKQVLDLFCQQMTTLIQSDLLLIHNYTSNENAWNSMNISQKYTPSAYVPITTNHSRTKTKLLWKFVNNECIVFFRNTDMDSKFLNDYYKIEVPIVNYNDLLLYDDKTDNFTIECFGIPILKSGVAYYIEVSAVPAYITTQSAFYVVEEVETKITICDGFIMKIHSMKSMDNGNIDPLKK